MSSTLIEIPQWGTATLIELIWLASGLLALAFSMLRMPSLWRDYMNAVIGGEPDVRRIARSYLRRESIRIAQASCVISVGAYASLTDPLIPGPARVSVTGLVLTGALILISLFISLQSLLDWYDRRYVRRMLADEH